MAQIGNKLNSFLNGEWCRHARSGGKQEAAGARRMEGKEIILHELNPKDDDSDKAWDIIHANMYDNGLTRMVELEGLSAFISEDKPQLFPLEELCIRKAA